MKEEKLNVLYGIILFYIIDSVGVLISKLSASIIMLLDMNIIAIPVINFILYTLIIFLFLKFINRHHYFEIKLWLILLTIIIRFGLSYMGNNAYTQNESLTAEELGLVFSLDKFLFILFEVVLIFITYWQYYKLIIINGSNSTNQEK